jgi:hypothetical protein
VGTAIFQEVRAFLGGGHESSILRWTVAGAVDFGAGVDLRLTRLMSLRGEARDFVVTGAHLGGETGHHHPIYGLGFGFHW